MRLAKYQHSLLLALFLSLLLTACGGGGGGSNNDDSGNNEPEAPDANNAPPDEPQSFSAVIGKVTSKPDDNIARVSGAEYDVSGATITTNRTTPATAAEINVGDVVRLNVTSMPTTDIPAIVSEVDVTKLLSGLVNNVDQGTNQLTILGQTVSYSAQTAFIGANAAELAANENAVINISGFTNPGRASVATRVKLVSTLTNPASVTIEALGVVRLINNTAQTLFLNTGQDSLQVRFRDAEAPSSLANGMPVMITGHRLPADNIVNANTITEVNTAQSLPTGTRVSMEGVVSRVSDAMMVINDQAISTAQLDIDHFALLNRLIKVTGTVDNADILVADQVNIEESANARLTAMVQAVDGTNAALQMLGATVTLTADSVVASETNPAGALTLANIAVGDWVAIEALVSDGVVTATEVIVQNRPATIIINAPLQAAAAPNIELMTISFGVNDLTVFNLDDGASTADVFFSTIVTGNQVEAVLELQDDGTLLATTIDASVAISGGVDDGSALSTTAF